jgi:hypothetical protein
VAAQESRMTEQLSIFPTVDRPRELIVDGDKLEVEMERIALAGGRVASVERVTGHNAQWKLRVYYS